jgi:hypothetical protein
MVEHILLCQHCGSERLVRNGRAPNGKQKFICHACGRRCRRNPLPRGYSEVGRAQILRAYQERCSLRGLQRTFGVAPANIAKWIKKAQSLAPLGITVVEPPRTGGIPPMLELDEVWSYIGRKSAPICCGTPSPGTLAKGARMPWETVRKLRSANSGNDSQSAIARLAPTLMAGNRISP